ncbi:hypothetical protein [Ralstonia solanacearum]|uniref:hypothetical protein n=1 Tax=Ralstonia solanacearum TaxID=305 RepID=UPI000E5822E7|nr:hypothetical protein [Ralstonia solanacearum]AXW22518.1 hypothetical protein CJO86_02335 [Ralstonia solanacearum]
MKGILFFYITVVFVLAACGQQASNDNQNQASKDELVRKMAETEREKSIKEIDQVMEDAKHPRSAKTTHWSKHEK